MKEHVEISHCPAPAAYMLRALSELTGIVRGLAKDILQIRAESIIINKDMMKAIKGDIIEEISENIKKKFDIMNRHVDHLFQQLGNEKNLSIKSKDTVPTKSILIEK